MKTRIFYSLLALLVTFTGAVSAQTGPIKGGTCWGAFGNGLTLNPNMTFNCQHIGAVTIAQIYEKGFRVVSTINHSPNGVVSLVIEEQRH